MIIYSTVRVSSSAKITTCWTLLSTVSSLKLCCEARCPRVALLETQLGAEVWCVDRTALCSWPPLARAGREALLFKLSPSLSPLLTALQLTVLLYLKLHSFPQPSPQASWEPLVTSCVIPLKHQQWFPYLWPTQCLCPPGKTQICFFNHWNSYFLVLSLPILVSYLVAIPYTPHAPKAKQKLMQCVIV